MGQGTSTNSSALTNRTRSTRSNNSKGMASPDSPSNARVELPECHQQFQNSHHQEQEEQQDEQDLNHTRDDLTLFLPDECLGLIFDRLDTRDRNSASLVCSRWLLAEGNSRRILSLSARQTLPIPCLRSTLLRFATLQKLGLKCERGVPSINDEALHVVAMYCRHLTKLKLKNCNLLTDSGLETFAASVLGTSFRSFSCCSCGFGARGLNALVKYCVYLEDLSVKKLRLGGEPNELVLGPSNLKRLSVKHIPDSGHVFAPLIATSKHLHTLIIFKVSGQWDKLLELVVVDGLKELVELRMERIYLGDRGLQAVAKCKKLQVLFLARTPECSNVGITAIANGCRLLRKLHVDGCFSGRIGDKGLTSIAERCPELKELVLIGLSATSESLSLLFSNCKGLERLALWNSETFGDRELTCIANKCKALRKLCIKCCPISDKGLEALAGGCPSLSKVKIKKCRGVSVAGTSTLSMAHNGLVITLESDPTAVVMAQVGEELQQPVPPPATLVNVAARMNGVPPAARSPFSRARSVLAAVLGRVLA